MRRPLILFLTQIHHFLICLSSRYLIVHENQKRLLRLIFVVEYPCRQVLAQRLDEGDASDFRELSNNDLIDILRNDESETERELADAALQERANEQR
jgi:hypothetical protein